MKNKIRYSLYTITLLMFVTMIKPIKVSAQNIATLSNQAGTYTVFENQNSMVEDKKLWASPLIGEYAILLRVCLKI